MKDVKNAKDLIPWRVTDISVRPYEGYWSFNPSIHFDGALWRCVLRCCDYAMPGGVTIRSKNARPTGQQTKNAMVILDPQSWKPVQVFKMGEKDELPRASTPHVGYEDMRLFKTDKGGLQGIAASLHLKRDRRMVEGGLQHQPPEQVVLSFDENYDIVAARPIRGDGWSGTPQKNWVPFDHCTEPRFLFSIDKGTMFDDRGTVSGDAAKARPSTSVRAAPSPAPRAPAPSPEAPSAPPSAPAPAPAPAPEAQVRHPTRKTMIRGGDVQIVRGGRIKVDTLSSRPSSRPSSHPSSRPASRAFATRSGNDSTRVMGTGRSLGPKYNGLRGGTQLVRVGDDAWLGIGHEMTFLSGKKYYWHVFYLVDSCGKLTAASAPLKLAPNGIEFAAGLAIDGDRVVVSFGVDDMECRIGETQLSAVLEKLVSIAR
jgi:hypothetical protein